MNTKVGNILMVALAMMVVSSISIQADVKARKESNDDFRRSTFWFVMSSMTDAEVEARVDLLARSGVNGVVIGGGRHHYLHDELPYIDDYIAAAKRMIDECHKHGIKVAEHHSAVLNTRKDYAEEHKDWIQRDFGTGEASVWPEYQTYAFCPNNLEFREHYWKIAKRIMVETGADSLMSDDTVFHHGCCCPACAKRWSDEVGGDIREAYKNSRDPNTREWRQFTEARRRWYADFRDWLRKRQAQELPETSSIALVGSIMSYWGTQTHGGAVEGGLDTADIAIWEPYNPADFYSWRRLSADAEALAEAGRVRGTVPMCMPYADTAEKRDVFDPQEEVFMWAFSTAHGIPFTLSRVYLTGLLQTDTPRDYFIFERDRMALYQNTEPAASVGILFSHCSRDNDPTQDSMHNVPAIAWSEALGDDCVPYRAITEETLDTGISKEVRTLIMPNVFAISDAHLSKIEDFVRDGGTLIATRTLAICDQWGDSAMPARQDRLEKLLGARINSDKLGANQPDIQITSATKLRSAPDFYTHPFGKGRVFYSPLPVETAAFQDWMNSQQIFKDPRDKNVSCALSQLALSSNDSQPVRITRDNPDAHVLTTVRKRGNQLLIYIVNSVGADLSKGRRVPRPSRVVWASPIQLTLTFPKIPKSVQLISLDKDEDMLFPRSEKSVTLTTPHRFGLVVVDF